MLVNHVMLTGREIIFVAYGHIVFCWQNGRIYDGNLYILLFILHFIKLK